MTSAQRLVQEVREQHPGVSFKACSTAQEAVTAADIIVTATFSTTPVLQAAWVKPGAHINGTLLTLSGHCHIAAPLVEDAKPLNVALKLYKFGKKYSC